MRRVWAGLAVVAGCGRVGFTWQERRADAASDAATPDAFTVCHTGTWSIPQPLALVNSASHESDPTITGDGLTMFYTGNAGTSQGYAIWTATRATTNDPFGNPMLVPELDDAADDQDPSISPDGLTIYFDSTRGVNRELYVAKRNVVTDPFGIPSPVIINGEVQALRTAPAISADGLDLYYASGNLELAHATRSVVTADFTFVRELDEVNAAPTDGSPIVSSDGLELFFESFRNAQAEMFRATRPTTSASWENLTIETTLLAGAPPATGYGGPELSPDGRTLYLFRNETSIDLYVTTRSCN